jgi:hypothetical protein
MGLKNNKIGNTLAHHAFNIEAALSNQRVKTIRAMGRQDAKIFFRTPYLLRLLSRMSESYKMNQLDSRKCRLPVPGHLMSQRGMSGQDKICRPEKKFRVLALWLPLYAICKSI